MGGGPPDFPQGSTCLAVLWIPLAGCRFLIQDFHPLWSDFPDCSDNDSPHISWSVTPECTNFGLGSSDFARRYFRNRCFFLFLRLLRCFSSPVPGVWLWIHHTSLNVYLSRFPHSEISGSKDICSSPKLIAAYHVFLCLLVPRHPPCALSSLTRCLFAAGTAPKRRCIALHPWLFVYIFRFAYLSICLGCLVS